MTITTSTAPNSIEGLRANVRAEVLCPGDPGYEEARTVWNGMVDRRPKVIVRCHSAADVATAVRHAVEAELPLSVRGGGHNVAGKAVSDGGVMIDLSPMRGVRVDPGAQRVQVGGGATWADVDHETIAHGLATTGGVVSKTGVAGLTLGGGIGWLARSYGLASDNLVAADVVTADGRLVRASERDNPELFWALRGGGGNFGVVTTFEFQLHEVGPDVLTAQTFHPLDDLGAICRFQRGLMADAPDELTCYVMVTHLPSDGAIPPEMQGTPVVALIACHSGSFDEAGPHLERIAAFGSPLMADVVPVRYSTLQQSFDGGTPDGARYYFRAHMLDDLPDEAIAVFVEHVGDLPGEYTMVGLEPLGGAIARLDGSATAWPHRATPLSLIVGSGWTHPTDDEAMRAWTRRLHDAMAPYATGGVYVNYTDGDEDRAAGAWGEHWDRLREIKRRWDPDNVFHGNQSVEPPTGDGNASSRTQEARA